MLNTLMKLIGFAVVAFVFSSASAAKQGQGYSLTTLWETAGFSMPESVVAIPGHPWLYVSNVNGEDSQGFISRVGQEGVIDTLKWVDGIQTPTGMAAFEGFLYVVDQTQLHKINLDSGEITQSFASPDATSLNDVDISADGQIFVSELQGGAIHKLEGDSLIKWSTSELFPYPNGVMVDGASLLVGNVGLELSRELTPDKYGAIYRINMDDKSVKMLPQTEKMGTWDGLAPFANGVLASSPFSGELWFFIDDEKSLLDKTEGGIADIGTDAENGIVYAPKLFANTVTAYQLDEFKWNRVLTKAIFDAEVTDVYFGDAAGRSVAKSDGTIVGKFNNLELQGTWKWEGEYFCRTSTLGDIDLGSDCIVIEVTENQMRLTLQEGKGPSVIYNKM